MKNPNWTKDELILALELYFRDETSRGNKTHPEVIKLSQILNSLPIHSGGVHVANKTYTMPFVTLRIAKPL